MKKTYYDPGFHGTDNYYKAPAINFVYTDSVKYFCHEKEAYWILDVISSYNFKYDFLVLTFDLTGENAVVFTAKEDDGRPNIAEQYIPFTTLDVSVKLYMEGNVVLFPSDH